MENKNVFTDIEYRPSMLDTCPNAAYLYDHEEAEMAFGEAYADTLDALKNNRVRSISVMDWTGVDCSRSRNGGSYAEGVKFYPDTTAEGRGRYFREEATSGEFCPYCGKWNCCGDCYDPDSVPLDTVIDTIVDGITNRQNGADIRITVHTVYGGYWAV